MQKPFKLLSIITIIGLTFFLINATKVDNSTVVNNHKNTYSIQKNVSQLYEIKALKLPSYMEFAGEPVPLEKNDIREAQISGPILLPPSTGC